VAALAAELDVLRRAALVEADEDALHAPRSLPERTLGVRLVA
jgi:hypothetical protein